ncbi:hypothetical protein N431DRAFT_451417 [Stipitochalara longipes BDJ]|nr:hypothetical protein N431DRAFT_451417 [Stipitochalara longipes BDJ]
MPSLFDLPVTPITLSPTRLNLGESPDVSASESNIKILSSTNSIDEKKAIDPTKQLHRLNLSEVIPDPRTKDEIIQALQTENQLLKEEVKDLTRKNKCLENLQEQSHKAVQILKIKHGRKMDVMNQCVSKANRLESQLTKIHKLVGDALGLEPVKENHGGNMSELIHGLEGEVRENEEKGRGTKREAVGGDDEDMENMDAINVRDSLIKESWICRNRLASIFAADD